MDEPSAALGRWRRRSSTRSSAAGRGRRDDHPHLALPAGGAGAGRHGDDAARRPGGPDGCRRGETEAVAGRGDARPAARRAAFPPGPPPATRPWCSRPRRLGRAGLDDGRSRCEPARSWASRAWSVPAAASWPEPCSAPTGRPPGQIGPRRGTPLGAGHGRLRAGVAMMPESRKDAGPVLRALGRENVDALQLDRLSPPASSGAGRRAARRPTSPRPLRRARRGHGPGPARSPVATSRRCCSRGALVRPRGPDRRRADARRRHWRETRDLRAARRARRGRARHRPDLRARCEEVLGLSHRVLVMRPGHLVAESTGEQISESRDPRGVALRRRRSGCRDARDGDARAKPAVP